MRQGKCAIAHIVCATVEVKNYGMCSRRLSKTNRVRCRILRQIYAYRQDEPAHHELSGLINQFLAASGKQISRKTVADVWSGDYGSCSVLATVDPIDQVECTVAEAMRTSRTSQLDCNRTGHAYYQMNGSVCHRFRHQLIWQTVVPSRKYP
ncbi:hypothetical protein TNCV_5016101 [Trichonephila clavipes]|nr:hypothetical protein TNCV_5016101 [Trichonephila clavipes]